MTAHICVASPLPTIDSIMASFSPLLTFPPSVPALGLLLPTLPSPLFPRFRQPNLGLVLTAVELQAVQLLQTELSIIQPLVDFLGGSLSSLLPTIPGLGALSLADLLAGDPGALISAVQSAITGGFAHLWDFVPVPLFPNLNIPAVELPVTLVLIVSQYMLLLVESLVSLINSVTGGLHIGGMPAIPAIPTISDIEAAILAGVPGASSFADVVTAMRGGLSLSALLAGLSFPGLPAMPALPIPLIPSLKAPAIEFAVGMAAFYSSLAVGLLTPILSFVEDTLASHLSFTFPLICIDIPTL
jgi:hypothetical protein